MPNIVLRKPDQKEILDALLIFNADAKSHLQEAVNMLKSSTYFLYHKETGYFAPNKFCGFAGMTFEFHQRCTESDHNHSRKLSGFGGTEAREAIETELAIRYAPNPDLHQPMLDWAANLLGYIIPGKEWRFITLDLAHPQSDLTFDNPAVDLAEPPPRVLTTTSRIIRDTALAQRVKALHENKCQIRGCDYTIVLPDGRGYAEGHHIRPLGEPHNGPDVMANILCVCPNHHAELDYGVRPIDLKVLRPAKGHVVDEKYIRYHNDGIHRKNVGGRFARSDT